MTRVNCFNLIFKLHISIFYLQSGLVKISPLVQNRFDSQSKFIKQFCFKETSLEKYCLGSMLLLIVLIMSRLLSIM